MNHHKSAIAGELSLLSLSVQEFFENCNWIGGKSFQLDHANVSAKVLSLTMSVNDFFQAIAWDGKPTIGALPISNPVPAIPVPSGESSDVTIDDLLNLF